MRNRSLSALLAAAGVLHVVRPRTFDGVVPRALPGGPRPWTYASGAAELACAGALLSPGTRRAGALGTAALFTAYLPAHTQMIADARGRSRRVRAVLWLRLAGQVPLIAWALRTAGS